jgi:hypothetical protein
MKLARVTAVVLLVFLALGALWGSSSLIANAHGVPFGLFPQSLLRHSPFHSYLIPGITLLFANGLLALWVLWLELMRKPLYPLWITSQGCVLLGFLGFECWMLRVVMWAHYLYGGVALALIISGLILRQMEKGQTPVHRG